MFRKILLLTIFCILASQTAYARIYIPVDQPSDQKFPIAVTDLRGGGTGREISSIIRNDLTLSGYFNVLPTELFRDVAKEEGSSDESIRFAYWSAIGAHAMVKGEVESKSGKTTITLRLFDTQSREMLVGKQYKVDKDNMRRAAHRFSDEIMEALTGIRGVFNSKITFTAVTGKKTKDVFVMDMDGYKPYAVTHNKSITLSSAWSPDGGSLVYTSYHRGNPDLYITRLGQKDQKRITNGQGSNITPAWSPDGGTIAFASSISGSSNIYTMPPSGKKMNRVTRNYNIDISPAWAPGGDQIVFSSERAGGLHLFKMSSSGDNISRLTFVGYQNDMPDWSPIGDKIVFAGRDMGTFDIFIMNPDGSNIQRLTIGTGSNEHPTFSPDGRLITFSSTRDGGAAIYIMRSDGSNQTRISKGNGLLPAGPQGRMIMRAVIDIGTNSVLMLAAKKNSSGAIELGTEKVMITRLGEGLTETGCISKEGEDRTIAALKSFLQTCGVLNVTEITAVGTEVLRKASNAVSFTKRVKSELGIDIEIISAEKEARLTYEASSVDFGKDIIVVDIGGGSTEFIKGPKPLEIVSLPIGSVSLTEDFIHSDPVSDDDESELRTSIFDHLLHDVPIETSPETQNVIATAGTATTLMAMHFEVEKYDSRLIHGQNLSIDAVARIIDELRERSVEERKELPGLQPERAEVIFAGAVLFHEVMKHLGLREITVSDRGLRWGLFYEKFCSN